MMTMGDAGDGRPGRAEQLFLLVCGGLILLALGLMISHGEDLAPLIESIRTTFEAWQRDLEIFIELLQGADPETLREGE